MKESSEELGKGSVPKKRRECCRMWLTTAVVKKTDFISTQRGVRVAFVLDKELSTVVMQSGWTGAVNIYAWVHLKEQRCLPELATHRGEVSMCLSPTESTNTKQLAK